MALVPALVTLSYAYLLDKNYEGCRRELDRALKILTTHEGEKAASTTLVREHLGLLAYYEEDFEEAQKHFRDVHDILVAHGRAADDEDVVRQLENLATATCRTEAGPGRGPWARDPGLVGSICVTRAGPSRAPPGSRARAPAPGAGRTCPPSR